MMFIFTIYQNKFTGNRSAISSCSLWFLKLCSNELQGSCW